MCVVSDRHESIIHAVSKVYPTVPHLACICHLWKNVTKQYTTNSEVLSPIFYSLAKAYSQDEFDKLMEKIGNVDIQVKRYLEDAGRDKWSRIYSPVNRGWTMTSNIAECINGKLVETSTEYVYTVNDGPRRFIIDLKKKTCSCRMFQLDEIPCSHAWAVLKNKNLTADVYCSDLFKPETVVNTYDVPVDPLPDETEWNVPKSILDEVVMPPIYKRPPGRPKKKRDKPLQELMIGKRRNSCGKCGCLGHNRRSCDNPPLNKKNK
ncbi:uncharacterized protein LOC132607964 [Lycium barbarum]|uniref:uncharacterized protein LOC132607964 n=1 Tax=Lycium barbarum TaxID=112863 RepID=UPI00293F797C|nr:uncharacterized protein LOC132607964 [Lycium barbarum]